ncbi:MAG: hypothetical protein EXR93_12140 [Gemmatimonadetes bacterium]|nr:hypothetical protein [Gemmatimonadota bacterium]
MSRVKITEYRAKKLLLGSAYRGIPVTGPDAVLPKKGRYVVKVDQGVKQRLKKGLLFLDQSAAEVPKAIARLKRKGFSRFLVEPMAGHKAADERYLSLERVREGIRVIRCDEGGVDIEERPEKTTVSFYDVRKADRFLAHAVDVFEKHYFSFLEINPLVGDTPLDAAVLVDSAAAFFADGWSEEDIVSASASHPAEARVADLQNTSPASFKLTVLNPDGSLFFLLSGGGGSIVIADEAALKGFGAQIGNYGEYSGGPSREETYLYAREVIGLMLASKARRKALVIAGGVANFTDVKQTFLGIIDALGESAEDMRKRGIKVFVRRGGPNEKEGLRLMSAFLKKHHCYGAVYGSDVAITAAADDAIKSLRA